VRGAKHLARFILPMDKDLNATAVRLLAMREHSQTELQRKLLDKGFAASAVAQALLDLRAQNLLSDERFTEAFVLSRRERGSGPVKIQAELQQRGVDNSLISRYLDFGDPDWLQRAEQVRQKKFGRERPAAYPLQMQQARFLANRGFSHEQIRRVLDAELETG
jgi:regulatory protein